MELFTSIDDGVAIVRLKNGVHKQVKLYQRAGRVWLGIAGGFVRITAKFGETWGTSHPDIKVVAFDGDGIRDADREPRFAPLKVAA